MLENDGGGHNAMTFVPTLNFNGKCREAMEMYPDPFVVDLDIQTVNKRIHTSYGIVKQDTQSSDSISQLLKDAGLHIISLKAEGGQFSIQCIKE